jgi:hypothetical protein
MIYYMSVNVWDWRTEWYDEDDYQKNPKDNPKYGEGDALK